MFIEGLAWCGLFNNMICNMLSYFELSEPTLEARTKSEMTDFLSAKKGLTFEIDKISRNLYDYCTWLCVCFIWYILLIQCIQGDNKCIIQNFLRLACLWFRELGLILVASVKILCTKWFLSLKCQNEFLNVTRFSHQEVTQFGMLYL